MPSPWANISASEPINFQDIISEDVAKELQIKEDKKYAESITSVTKAQESDISPDLLNEKAGDLDSDALLARTLQQQFDKEYDDLLKDTKPMDTSKILISSGNYSKTPQNAGSESDSEEEEGIEDVHDYEDWDDFEFATVQKNIAVNGPKNACSFKPLSSELYTELRDEFGTNLPSKVYNSLKLHAKHEENRRYKFHDKKEDQATAEFGVDQATRIQLYKMISNQMLERVNGVISVGKEAVILHADSDPAYPHGPLPKECVIKVFKTTLAEFKQREKYIRQDKRFMGRLGKQRIRNTIHLWAEKEMRNLFRLQKAGIPCPEVITLKKHLLVMSFIGENHCPAPKLKDAILKLHDYALAYNQVVEALKNLYNNARLIHADLSEYNILWYKKQCYFIDVSQSIEPTHRDAFEFLMTDIENITKFFTHKSVPDIIPSYQLFIEITGCDFRDKMALEALTNSFKIKPHMVGISGMEPYDSFEATWQKVKSGHFTAATEVSADTENLKLLHCTSEEVDLAPASVDLLSTVVHPVAT